MVEKTLEKGRFMGVANQMDMRITNRVTDAVRHAVCRLRNMVRGSGYRPELHYMRGPGPKSRAKGYSEAGPDQGDGT